MCNSSTTPYKLFWICFTKCLLWVAYYQNRNTIIIIETYDYTLKYTPLMRIKTKICVSRWKKYTINNSMKACILSVHLCCLSFVRECPDSEFLTSDSETAWDDRLFKKVCRTMKGCSKNFAMKCFVFLWCTCSALLL